MAPAAGGVVDGAPVRRGSGSLHEGRGEASRPGSVRASAERPVARVGLCVHGGPASALSVDGLFVARPVGGRYQRVLVATAALARQRVPVRLVSEREGRARADAERTRRVGRRNVGMKQCGALPWDWSMYFGGGRFEGARRSYMSRWYFGGETSPRADAQRRGGSASKSAPPAGQGDGGGG